MNKNNLKKLKVQIQSLFDYVKGPPCEQTCPVHTESGRYVREIANRNYRLSYNIAKAPNPFASVCSRVCSAPCEDMCRRKYIDEPVAIRALKWFVCNIFEKEKEEIKTPPQKYPEKIAIIGGGPAGVTCAEILAKFGYKVAIFEAGERLGGSLWKYIPPFRLPRDIVELEINKLEKLGVEIKTDTPLSKDFGISHLKEMGYNAIFIACGTNIGTELPIQGREGQWVLNAIDFLYAIHQDLKFEVSGKVIVIGGGYVALDAARTALRCGAEEVTIVYRRTKKEMPIMRSKQGEEELKLALNEGIKLVTKALPRKIITNENKKVIGIEIGEVETLFDEKGNYSPVFKENSLKVLDANIVIWAIGQKADLSFIKKDDGIKVTERGTIEINPDTLETTAPGIFAGGDVAFGPGIIIKAVADGKLAAKNIHKYLRGEKLDNSTEINVNIEKLNPETLKYSGYETIKRHIPEIKDEIDGKIVFRERVMSEEEAILQAQRCFDCYVHTIYDPDKCIFCKGCEEVCPRNCLKFIDISYVEGDDTYSNAFLENSKGIALIKDDDLCIRCGLCASICPTEAMTMEKIIKC